VGYEVGPQVMLGCRLAGLVRGSRRLATDKFELTDSDGTCGTSRQNKEERGRLIAAADHS